MVILWERWDRMVFFRENHWHQWFFNGFATLWPSPLTTFLLSNHWTRWFFNNFWVIQSSPFNYFQPPDHCFQWFLMVFRLYTPIVNNGFENLHPTKCMILFIFDEVWNAIWNSNAHLFRIIRLWVKF